MARAVDEFTSTSSLAPDLPVVCHHDLRLTEHGCTCCGILTAGR